MEDLHEHADLIRIFLKNNTADDIIRLIDHTCKQFIDLFSARSSDRPVDEERIKLLAVFITDGGYYMLNQWLLGEIHKSPGEIAQLFADVAAFCSVK